jgi:hypothetical protein
VGNDEYAQIMKNSLEKGGFVKGEKYTRNECVSYKSTHETSVFSANYQINETIPTGTCAVCVNDNGKNRYLLRSF